MQTFQNTLAHHTRTQVHTHEEQEKTVETENSRPAHKPGPVDPFARYHPKRAQIPRYNYVVVVLLQNGLSALHQHRQSLVNS